MGWRGQRPVGGQQEPDGGRRLAYQGRSRGACRTNFLHRSRFGRVRARQDDREKAEPVEVEEERDTRRSYAEADSLLDPGSIVAPE